MPDLKPFGFSICPEGQSWNWRALRRDGRMEEGAAPSRAAAAASVIRILAAGATPSQLAVSAPDEGY